MERADIGVAGSVPVSYTHLDVYKRQVVDSQAWAEALNTGKIAGAAVDVFEMEPPVPEDHVLLKAKNLIATPHVAFASRQAFEKRAVIVAENIKKWMEGRPQNVIC